MSRTFEGQAETHKLDDIWELLNDRLKPAREQEYLLGLNYKDAMDLMTRSLSGLYVVIEALQNRVLELELELDKLKQD